MEQAQKLLARYGIDDWKRNWEQRQHFFCSEYAKKPGCVWTATGSVFPTICVLPLQNTDVWKFPYGNFLPLKASKPQQKTAPKGGSLTGFDCVWYDADGRCYFWRSDHLFLSRSLRQEGGGACAEKGFSAFYVCSHPAVHFLYKSALTARVDSETVNDYFKFLIN